MHCCGDAVDNNVDDVGYLKDIVNQLSTWLPINIEKGIVGTGFSNGAFLLERSVVSGANIFSAIAPVGGHSYMYNEKQGSMNMTGRDIPIYIHHAIRDPVIKFDGCCATSKCCCGVSEKSPIECMSVNTIFEKWISMNQCSGKSAVEMKAVQGSTISSTCFSGTGCSQPTKLCVHHNVLHAYPGRAKGHFPTASSQLSILFFLLQSVCEQSKGRWSAPSLLSESFTRDDHFNHVLLIEPVTCRYGS